MTPDQGPAAPDAGVPLEAQAAALRMIAALFGGVSIGIFVVVMVNPPPSILAYFSPVFMGVGTLLLRASISKRPMRL